MKEPRLFVAAIALVGRLASGSHLYAAAEEHASPRGTQFAVGGEVSLTASVEDRGWFNETEYERSTLNLARLALFGELRAGRKLALGGGGPFIRSRASSIRATSVKWSFRLGTTSAIRGFTTTCP